MIKLLRGSVEDRARMRRELPGVNSYVEQGGTVLRLKVDGNKLVGDLKAEGPTAPPIRGKMTLSKEK